MVAHATSQPHEMEPRPLSLSVITSPSLSIGLMLVASMTDLCKSSARGAFSSKRIDSVRKKEELGRYRAGGGPDVMYVR